MQSKKFLRTIFLSLIVLIITTNYATKAIEKIRLYVNQEEITSASPVIINNRTYVPIRFVEEALGGKVQWNQEKRQVDVNTNIKIIASIPEENIYLYANNKKYENNKETSMYKGLLLSVNNRSKYFDWENIDIITDYPELYYLDLTGDDKKELVVILSKGHGTGASSDSIHIIDSINFSEYKIENPLKTIKNNVETTIFPKKQEAEIKINNNISKVDLEKKRNEAILIFENYISYEIIGNKLKCIVGLDINTDDYVGTLGTINIQYSYKNNEFIPNNISFEY